MSELFDAVDVIRTKRDGGRLSDGQIDWVWDRDTQTKSIRWYGMPRDTNNDGKINMKDVVPLWYVMSYEESGDPNAQYQQNRVGNNARAPGLRP